MPRLEGQASVIDFNPNETNSVATHNLGQEVRLADKRVFRYAKAGASNISRGKLQLAPTPKTNHHNVAWSSGGAINATTVTVTLGATAAVANEYAEGYLVVNDATGEGTSYKIKSHPAANSSATLELTLFDPIRNTALVSGSEMTLVHNAYNGVIEGTSATQRPAGIPLVNITAGEYGWLQTKGVCPALIGTAATLGALLTADGSTAGAVTDATDVTAPQAQFFVGQAFITGVATEYQPIELNIV